PTPLAGWRTSRNTDAASRSTSTRVRPSPAPHAMDPDRSSTSATPTLGRGTAFAVTGTVHSCAVSTTRTVTEPDAVVPAGPAVHVSHTRPCAVTPTPGAGTVVAGPSGSANGPVGPATRCTSRSPSTSNATARAVVSPSGTSTNASDGVRSVTARPSVTSCSASPKRSRPDATSRMTCSAVAYGGWKDVPHSTVHACTLVRTGSTKHRLNA